MAEYRQLIHVEGDRVLVSHARWCASFGSKLRGFTFRRALAEDEGLVLVEKRDNRVNAAIHMLFVFFELGVIWVNDSGQIVDLTVARPWRLSYVPRAPARYVIEAHPLALDGLEIGHHIRFVDNVVAEPS